MGIAFSANLGFLWSDRPLPYAIRAAAAAGFDAVECHFPQLEDADAVAAVLSETGLPMISLNTWPGDRERGDFGLAAVPGREDEARSAIREAVALAARLGARHVHVMAGRAEEGEAAHRTFVANLRLAADLAAKHGIGILIEPINRGDVPGYFLTRTDQAAELIAEAACANVRMMFDCYHVQITEGDVTRKLSLHLPSIGHVQIAAVPSRAEPDEGEIDYPRLLAGLTDMGYRGLVGAEYRPRAGTEAGLGWLSRWRKGPGG